MPAKETVKLYFVVALALVALVVAYFRFFYNKEDPAPQVVVTQKQPTATATATAGRKSFKIETVKKRPDEKAQEARIKRRPSPLNLTEVRDILEPPPIPTEAIQTAVTASQVQRATKKPEPDEIPLILKGTLIGGKKPMAIINEKFILLGEKIEIFRVVRIDANRVVLKAGDYIRTLTVLKPDELLNQQIGAIGNSAYDSQ